MVAGAGLAEVNDILRVIQAHGFGSDEIQNSVSVEIGKNKV